MTLFSKTAVRCVRYQKGMDNSTPPQVMLYRLATAYYASQALYVVAKLRVADHLVDGPRDAVALAAATETNADALRRVLRLVTAHGVLEEHDDGRFSLTPLGEALRSGSGSSGPAVQLFAGPAQWRAWGDLLESVRTGAPAFERVHGQAAFDYFEAHPEEGAIFDDAMLSFTRMAAARVSAAYDFSELTRVLDVGGGTGALLAGILTAHPHLEGAVLDLPRTEPGARATFAVAGLGERARFVAGDFFAAVPPGYDAYLLKHVIHDWNDDDATRILRRVREAIGDSGSRVLLLEGLYPARVDGSFESRGATGNDCNMLIATGGRQRSESELRALLSASGFSLARIVDTGMVPVLEGRPA